MWAVNGTFATLQSYSPLYINIKDPTVLYTFATCEWDTMAECGQ